MSDGGFGKGGETLALKKEIMSFNTNLVNIFKAHTEAGAADAKVSEEDTEVDALKSQPSIWLNLSCKNFLLIK